MPSSQRGPIERHSSTWEARLPLLLAGVAQESLVNSTDQLGLTINADAGYPRSTNSAFFYSSR